MTPAAVPTVRPPIDDVSDRVRLARTALHAATSLRDVVRGDAGGPPLPRVTLDRGEQLDGVLAIAEPGGRYGVALRLVAGLVPLHALADRIRTDVRGAAARAGLSASLGQIDIEFVAVLTADEVAVAALDGTEAVAPTSGVERDDRR